jgi:nicotinamidase-related amidase
MADWRGATALIVVDVQQGLDDDEYYGRRNNADCELRIGMLLDAWRAHHWPVVFVQHASTNPDSPLYPDGPGHRLKPVVSGECDLHVNKRVSSAFVGEPDLHEWLQGHGITGVAVCGIQTNMCCESTARMASDLGYDTLLVLDATHTFDLAALDGDVITADELARTTAAVFHHEFGQIVSTKDLTG